MRIWFLEPLTSLFLILTTPVYISFSSPQEGVAVLKLGDLKLQHLHLLFRHGDRSPIVNAFNTSIPFEKLWPSGYGQLTEKGIVQEFQLGRWLREKYGAFIPLNYNASEFHMRSTDVDRTLMSAQAVLAGVYENFTSPLKPYGVSWTPIPVHTVKQRNDVLLSVADCPRLELLRNLQMQSEAAREYERKHQQLFDLLSQVSGRKIDRTNLWELHDMAICMKSNNMSLPGWCTKEVVNEMTEVETFYWSIKHAGTPETLRLQFGVFISAFVAHINAVINGKVSPMFGRTTPLSVQHVLAYSAHDIQVSYLLSALGVFDGNLINYASAVIIELFGPEPPALPSDYYVRVLYKRGWTDTEGEYLPMPMCTRELTEPGCRVDRVLHYLDPLVMDPESFLRECTFPAQRNTRPSTVALHSLFAPHPSPVLVICVVILVLIGVCVAVAVAVFVACRFCSSGRDVPYALLQTS